MLSIQGIICKELKKQGKLPEKFNDLAMQPSKKNIGNIIKWHDFYSDADLSGDFNMFSHNSSKYFIFNIPNSKIESSTVSYPTAMDPSKDWQLDFKVNILSEPSRAISSHILRVHLPYSDSCKSYPEFAIDCSVATTTTNKKNWNFSMGKGWNSGPTASNSKYRVDFIQVTNSEEWKVGAFGIYKIRCKYTEATKQLVTSYAYGENSEDYLVCDTVTVKPSTYAFGTGYNYFGVEIANFEGKGVNGVNYTNSYAYLRDLQITSEGKVVFQRV